MRICDLILRPKGEENNAVASERRWWQPAVCAFCCGPAVLLMGNKWYNSFAMYVGTRAAQGLYNWAKLRSCWHFWGSSWAHGDSLLFAFGAAQIMCVFPEANSALHSSSSIYFRTMSHLVFEPAQPSKRQANVTSPQPPHRYAYVMRPETLNPGYHRFIVNLGPFPNVILDEVRKNCRGQPINADAVAKYIESTGGPEALAACGDFLSTPFPDYIPVRMNKPGSMANTAIFGALGAFLGCAKGIFPVYFGLTLVPTVVLKFNKFMRRPFSTLGRSTISALRSTSFLAGLCGSYLGIVMVQRSILRLFGWRDHKFIYWAAGFMSGWFILLEEKHRRSELALFGFPRAIDSLFRITMEHTFTGCLSVETLHRCQVLMFCASAAAVMCLYENESTRTCLSPLVVNIVNRFLGKHRGLSGEKAHAKGTGDDLSKRIADGTECGDDVNSEVDLITANTLNA